jgi:hypothetical protein
MTIVWKLLNKRHLFARRVLKDTSTVSIHGLSLSNIEMQSEVYKQIPQFQLQSAARKETYFHLSLDLHLFPVPKHELDAR